MVRPCNLLGPAGGKGAAVRRRRGFMLIELLVVIAILGVLLALLLPAVQRVRESAAQVQCKNNLHQMGVGLHHYHDDHGTLPPGLVSRLTNPAWVMPPANCNAEAPDLGPGWSFFAYLLPYIEQDPLYKNIR